MARLLDASSIVMYDFYITEMKYFYFSQPCFSQMFDLHHANNEFDLQAWHLWHYSW